MKAKEDFRKKEEENNYGRQETNEERESESRDKGRNVQFVSLSACSTGRNYPNHRNDAGMGLGVPILAL
jgi:hypothetical protein